MRPPRAAAATAAAPPTDAPARARRAGAKLVEEHGVVQGLFRGLFYRTALISTTFFLVNSFKQRLVPLMFPHTIDKKD